MGTTANRLASAARALFSAILLAVVLPVCPESAWADGGVRLIEVHAGSGDIASVDPAPTDLYTVSLVFDKNVSFATGGNDSLIEANLQKVYAIDAAGNCVNSFRAFGASAKDERQVIYLAATEWLVPLTDYTVVAEAGIVAGNGEDVTSTEYRSVFTTGPECVNGLTIYQNVGLFLSVSLLLVGAIVTLSRRRRENV